MLRRHRDLMASPAGCHGPTGGGGRVSPDLAVAGIYPALAGGARGVLMALARYPWQVRSTLDVKAEQIFAAR